MNSLKTRNQKGFTLVEVIVVAIIVAAMAAVAVPLYLGYVDSSRVNAASNAAGSLASFCGACRNTGGTVTLVGPVAPAVGGGSMTCSTNGTSIQIPADITAGHTPPGTGTPPTPGVVTGRHINSSAAASSFNY